ncbi:hypothetical protein BRADI_4g42595v3 [Brachypodium distachyon]|nr:hypothetical protein BRADI_4g42595v3 [Brachypodium distachyon]
MLSDVTKQQRRTQSKKIKDIVVDGLEIVGSILGAVAGIVVLWKKFRQQSGSTAESNEMLHTTRNPEPRAGGAPTQREAHGFVDTEVRHSCNYRMTRRTPTGEAALKDEKPNQRLHKTCLKPKLKLMKKQKVNCCDEHLFSRCPQRLEIFHFDGCCEQQEEAVVGDDGYCMPAPSP